MTPRPLVIVAMSGGVDSSVTAALLLEQGYKVAGLTMRLWTKDTAAGPASCCSVEGAEDARSVCQTLGIPHYVLNFEAPFQTHVVDVFVTEYLRGRTPNPCLACNRYLKFNLLLRKALALDADYLATGHYARVVPRDGAFHLLKGVDASKDQSYVLYTLGQWELSHLLLPLGPMRKTQVREAAARLRLPVAQKPDSQQICFIPDGDYAGFVAARGSSPPGDIVDARGQVIGRHEGLFRYTIGQRRRVGVARGHRIYVSDIDPSTNVLTVGDYSESLRSKLLLSGLSFVGPPVELPANVSARLRYRAPEVEAVLESWGDTALLHFTEPQRLPAPGQAVVFYRNEEVIGGATVEALCG